MAKDKPKKRGQPPKPLQLVKVPISFKLPQWLVTWMREYSEQQGTSMALMIEEALSEMHGVAPPEIKPKK
jgi:hypothetical protein